MPKSTNAVDAVFAEAARSIWPLPRMTISEWDDRYRVADRVAALEREVASLSRRLEAAVDVLLKLPDDDA